MCLGSYSINGNPTTLQPAHQREHGIDLCARTVEVVVVDVQLGGGVDGTGFVERDVNEGFAEDAVEDRVTEGAVFFEDLVDYILLGVNEDEGAGGWEKGRYPGVDFAFVAASDLTDVVLDDLSELVAVVDGVHPMLH
jgi:hypothetical protein